MLKKFFLLSSLCVLASTSFAKADAIGTTATYSLTVDGCSGTCGTGPFGTIKLVQTATGVVTVTETLASGVAFVATGAGNSLEFNLSGDPVVMFGSITPGFKSNGPDSASAFGSFDYTLTCSGLSCGPGASTTNPGPLSFTVTDLAGVNVSDFIGNGDPKDPIANFFFASDVIGTNTNTGNVAALAGTVTPPSVPEPSSLLLFGTGLVGAAGVVRRRLFSRS